MPSISCQPVAEVSTKCVLFAWLLCQLFMCGAAQPATAINIENDVLHFSHELESWLDTSDKRPCQDFLGFVCGRTLNATQAILEQQLEREQARFDTFLAADNDEQLLDAELKVKHFYDACRNARSLEELKSSLMYRQAGGWPAIDDTQSMQRKRRNITWLGVLTAFHEVGIEYIFQTRIEVKSNKRIVHLQPDTSMRYTLRKFEQLAEEVMQEYNVDGGRARLVALEILNFERNRRDIAKAQHDEKVLEFSYAQFKLAFFDAHLHAEWDNYFRKILGKNLKPTDTMLLQQLPKTIDLLELLQKTTITRLLNWLWIDYLMDKSAADCQALVQRYFEPVYQHIAARVAIDKVQMAQMYADIGHAYEDLLRPTSWIDEMSQQNSKQFLGRVMHLTLNGDAKLDEDFQALSVTKRNFYRNMEKVQRFQKTQKRIAHQFGTSTQLNTIDLASATQEFMSVFMGINGIMHKQNLSTPLNYALVGERFAEYMIAIGGSSSVAGAWRSSDSEREFSAFQQCMLRQHTGAALKFNLNNLVLKLLAQQQTLHALQQWRQKEATLVRRLDNLLAAGRLQLSFKRLYFIGTLLPDCYQYESVERQELLQSYLRNSLEFTQAFGCRADEPLYARNVCKVI